MASPINDLMITSGPNVFYTSAFRRVVESHLHYLRQHPESYRVDVDPHDAYKYEGDLNGLLRKLGVPQHYHWTVMRLNGLTSISQVDENLTTLMIPPTTVVNELHQRFMTTVKKRTA